MKKFIRFCLFVCIIVGTAGMLFIGYNFAYVKEHPITLSQLQPQTAATVIYDCNGKVYARLGSGLEKSNTSESFPKLVKEAVVSVEDKRFYQHSGVDVIRTGKAILDTLVNREFGAGGSTITQQLAKNATGDKTVSIARKVREWIYAIELENTYSKEEIITRYLNIIYMGKGLYGITDASEYYFESTPSELTVNQAAFLAGIIKSPETYIKDLEKGNNRKNTILYYMYEYGTISKSEYDSLKNKTVSINTRSRNNIQDWFVESVVYELADMLLERRYTKSYDEALKLVYQGGFTIHSTVNPGVQDALEDEWETISGINSGVVILTTDGKIVGIVGDTGKKSADLISNWALDAKRQPGSAIKPIAVYAPSFEENVVDNTCLVEDKEINYNGWTPGNYYDGYKGVITVQQALDVSCNTVAIQLMDCLGAKNSYNYLKKMGMEDIVDADINLALAIGAISKGVSPLEMASAYQTLANKGVWCEPIIYTKVDYKGEIFYDSTLRDTHRVFSEQTAYLITDLLVGVVEDEGATATGLQMSQVVAAKTGTTDDYKDRWLCAYTPYYVSAAWFGHKQPAYVAMKSSETQRHLRSVFSDIHSNLPNKQFSVPANIAETTVCNVSGLIASDKCQDTRTELIDTTKQYAVCEQCTGIIEGIANDIGDAIQDSPIGEFFEGLFGGLKEGSNTDEQTTVVDNPVYEEPQEEPATSLPEEEEIPSQEEEYFEEIPLPVPRG